METTHCFYIFIFFNHMLSHIINITEFCNFLFPIPEPCSEALFSGVIIVVVLKQSCLSEVKSFLFIQKTENSKK